MRRHAFDVTAFVWGVLFLITALVIWFQEVSDRLLDMRWVVPAGLVTVGIAGIANAIRASRR